jgi:hypothetical protein
MFVCFSLIHTYFFFSFLACRLGRVIRNILSKSSKGPVSTPDASVPRFGASSTGPSPVEPAAARPVPVYQRSTTELLSALLDRNSSQSTPTNAQSGSGVGASAAKQQLFVVKRTVGASNKQMGGTNQLGQ